MTGPEPRHADFPTTDAYLLAWYTWRALRRDARLTSDELAAQFAVTEAHIRVWQSSRSETSDRVRS